MKTFFASLLGTFVALLLFVFGATVLLFGFVAAISLMGEKAQPVKAGSYLVVDLSINLTDAPEPISGAGLLDVLGRSGEPGRLQLRTAVKALEAAGTDDRIAGLVLVGELAPSGVGSGFAALKEFRRALQTYKESGKPVVAYLEQPTTREYYLASVADEIVIDPYGLLEMPGLAAQPMFFAQALEKFGVGVQVTRVGKYKSAVEPFTRSDLSPESREQYVQLLGDVWSDLLADIAASRQLEPAAVQAVVDAEGIIRPDRALAAGLVTRVAYRDEVIADLKEATGVTDPTESFTQIGLDDYLNAQGVGPTPPVEGGSSGRIAVIYAEGDIVDGEGGPDQVGGTSFSRELRRLRQDDDIKAIVVRVNSPGGSASASEHIQRELKLARESKPVIVSMGSYAASGGYWIGAYGDRIFAEPSTITGSIGVFGVHFDVQELANERLGLTWDSVKTGRFADSFGINRPKTPEELAVVQGLVDWIYDQFLAKVAEGRKLERAVVEEIAQGRVWSGTQALKLGLVDELGGLESALDYAAEQAGLGAGYDIVEYPRSKPLAEALAEWLEDLHPAARVGDGPVQAWLARLQDDLRWVANLNDPRGLYARLPVELRLR